jgi:tetratricopeptide (TPR) repeat protein
MITHVAADRLEPYVGEWPFPPLPLGLPARATVRITAGDGHLVAFIPFAGTFELYLQPDGSFHEEDSHERRVPVLDDAGQFAGLADVESILTAAIATAAQGQRDRAERLMELVEGEESVQAGIGRAVVALMSGRQEAADRAVRALTEHTHPAEVEARVNAVGYGLLQAEQAERALEVFELNTRVFPDAFNTWDSLGEAHMTLGNDAEAIRCYERSLELNPENANADAMIERIRQGAARPD